MKDKLKFPPQDFFKEKSWREKLWKNGIIKSSRMGPRKCPQYVGTEEVGFFSTYGNIKR